VDDSGYSQISSVHAVSLPGPPHGGCSYRTLFYYKPDTDSRKWWGANRIRDPGSPHPQRWNIQSWSYLIWVIANALNIPPGTLQWQHEIQRNCTAVYTHCGRMWFNRYTA